MGKIKEELGKLSKDVMKKINRHFFKLNCYTNEDFYSLDKYLDFNEFRYIMMVHEVFKKVEKIPGHIVELGVARGRNAVLFANIIKSYNDDSRKYYGFDTFSGYSEEDLILNPKLSADSWKIDYKFVKSRIKNQGYQNIVEFIKGDIKRTVPQFIKENKDLKIALVYVDCNAYEPAIDALENLRNNLMENAIICIDEKRDGGESRAIKEFAHKYNLKILKDSTPFSLPAYLRYNT